MHSMEKREMRGENTYLPGEKKEKTGRAKRERVRERAKYKQKGQKGQ